MNNLGTILWVDDDPLRAAAGQRALESAGCRLWTAQAGAQALELAHTHLPDLILLDVNLPDIPGSEVCQRIKADPALRDIFVVMLSADYPDADRQPDGPEGGADGTIAWPVSARELVAHIRSILRIKHAEDDLRRREGETRSIYAAMTEMFALHELVPDAAGRAVDYRILDCNPAFERITGIPREQAIGGLASQLYGTGEAPFLDRYAAVAQTGTPLTFEAEFPPMGKWFHISVFSPGRGRFATFATDITPYENELARTQGLLQQVEQSRRALVSILEDRQQAQAALQASEEKYRALFNNAEIGMFRTRLSTSEILDMNEKYLEIFGRARSEMAGTKAWLYWADPPEREKWIQRLRVEGRVAGFECDFLNKQGGVRRCLLSARLYRDQDLLEGFIIDITERKQAEEALRESEARLALFIKHSPVYAYIKNVTPSESRVLVASENYVDLIGIPGSEMVGKSMPELYPPAFAAKLSAEDWEVVSSGRVLTLEEELNGHIFDTIKFPIAIGGKNLLAGYSIDITEQKRARAALQASEEKYRALFNNAEVGMFRTRLDGSEILDMNDKYLEIFGLTRSEMRGTKATLYWADPRERQELVRRLQAEGRLSGFECRMLNKDGEVRRCLTSVRLYPGQGILEGSIIDITERKQAEEALEESEARFRALIDQASVGISLSRNGKGLYANPAFLQMFGLPAEEAIGRPVYTYFAIPYRKASRARDRQRPADPGTTRDYESVCMRKDGSEFPVHVRATTVQLADGLASLAYITDITERKQAEEALKEYSTRLETAVEARTLELRQAQEQLIRQETLATLGQLAGGVGHELRNPLGVINTAVYYLKLVQPDADEKIKQYHHMIEQQVQISGMIINDLLDFARLPSIDRRPVWLPDLLQRVLTRFPVPASVRVVRRLPAGLPELFVDPLHLEQVLGNLVTNACQAMKDEGRLSISARREQGLVAIAVKDTGPGVTPENMQKLFQPLFTTKLRGIGLGLAVSKKLVEANGGRIEAASQPGKGTTFTIYLPVTGDPQQEPG